MEIHPGIHQVPGLRWSNAYLLVDEERLTLIDAGVPGDANKLLRYIKEIGISPHRLEQVVLTHSHPDHTGPIERLRRDTGAVITAHPNDTLSSQHHASPVLHYPGQPLSLGWQVPFLHGIPVQRLVQDGDTIPVLGGLQVIHTPGHTPGSICLYAAQHGVLFTGDTLLSDGLCFRRPVPFPGTNFRDYRASVERLSSLQFEVACVGHGQPLRHGGTLRLQDMLDNYAWMAPRWGWAARQARTLLHR